MNNDFYVGQIFTDRYPDEAIIWSNYHGYKMVNIGVNEINQTLWQIQEPDDPNPSDVPPSVQIAELKKQLFELNYYMQRKYQAGVNVPAGIKSQIESIYTKLAKLEGYTSQLDFTNALVNYNYNYPEIMTNIINTIYPIGSIYIGIQDNCPIQQLGIGTWVLISSGRVIQGSDEEHKAGTTVEAGLPNITGTAGMYWTERNYSGAFFPDTNVLGGERNDPHGNTNLRFDASHSNPIYGAADTVQPPAYIVNIWQRTS